MAGSGPINNYRENLIQMINSLKNLADLFSAQLRRRVRERTNRMNRRILNTTNMLGGAHRFCLDHPLTPPSTKATALIAVVGTSYTTMLTLGQRAIGRNSRLAERDRSTVAGCPGLARRAARAGGYGPRA
jgi:hypothetical protein